MSIFVTRDFKQGLEAVILTAFDNFLEIETDTPANYSAWQVKGRDEEMTALRDEAVKQAKKTVGMAYELDGTTYIVPITNEDAIGLLQVKSGFELGLTNTVLNFSNGVHMPIAAEQFTEFALWFVVERNKFFV